MSTIKTIQDNWPEKLDFAPVVICPYTRYEVLQRVIQALANNTLASQTALFLFSDAACCAEHTVAVQKVRDYLHSIIGFKYVFVIEREKNYGPLQNYEDAFQQILDRYDRYINIEDDIVTSPYFLQYMNDALVFYKDHPQIMAISAYKAPFKMKPLNSDVYFMQSFQPWGNAMWKKWRIASCLLDAGSVLQKLQQKSLLKKFNYYTSFIISNQRLLQMTVDKKINAQDVIISANILNQNGYVVYPCESMSNHIGFGDGVHCTVRSNDYETALSDRKLSVEADVFEDPEIVRRLHFWILRTHLKLLFRYLASFRFIKRKSRKKGKEF